MWHPQLPTAAEEPGCLGGCGFWRTANEGFNRMARRILAFALVILLCGAASVWGQINEDGLAGGNIEELPMKRPIMEYTLAGCFLLAAMAIGFKTSKRGNE